MDLMRRAQQLSPLEKCALAAAIAAGVVALPGEARAGAKDADAIVAIAEALSNPKAPDAAKKLEDALKGCEGAACEAATRAQLYVGLGVVYGTQGDAKKATAAFESALKEDPKVQPDKQFMTVALSKLFAEAQKNVKKTAPGATRPPPSKAQMDAVNAATAQLNQKDWSSCMGTIIAGMAESEFAAGKLLLAQCEDAGGLVLEATADARLAIKYADEEANGDLRRKAADLLAKLQNDTPSIVIVLPKTVDDMVVSVDGVVIPPDKADKPIPHNPGKATIEVKGKKGSFPFNFKDTETFDRGEQVKVNAESAAGGGNTSAIQACVQNARTAADFQRCMESGGKGRGLSIHTGLEVASYNDTVNVDVFSPTLFFSAENPTAGFSVGASYTVDVVSNASPDIVATASRRFDEIRNAGTLNGDVKVGPVRLGVDGGISVEPDYVGRRVGASISSDLYNKQVTPTLSYHLSYDTASLAHSPVDLYHRDITTHAIDVSTSVVTSPNTVLLFAGTAEFVLGDTSKLYRYIPMFSSSVAAQIPRGASPQLVVGTDPLTNTPNDEIHVHEQVPDSRDRFAVLARVAHRFEKSTIRFDERLYADNWGLLASSTDFRFLFDANKSFRFGPHVRFHIQNGVNFWERAYVASQTSTGAWNIPKFRTLDRELSPLLAGTFGGTFRWQPNDVVALNLVVEGIYTQYLDAIYVYDQLGLFTATTLELGFE
jgi:tetratricopeptide (TPR) repeat protein